MQQYDFNQNFKKFRKKLDLTETDKKTLLQARKDIRGTIRTTFNEKREAYFSYDSIKVLSQYTKNQDAQIKPVFMTQGSFAYKTINKPENPPTQQMDLDDGVYLPLSYIEKNNDFDRASTIMRNIIYNCVNDLCQNNSWNLEKKSKCLRITISNNSHIDLPIYSIPDDQINTINESVAMDSIAYAQMGSLDKILSYSKSTNILLATDNGWIESDPRVIQEWVRDTKKKLPNFIKYSRYIKAWRDYQYPNDDSGFSSLLIMAGVDKALSDLNYKNNNNIALDLANIVISISGYITGYGIKSPSDQSRLDNNLKDDIGIKLNNFFITLNQATKNGDINSLISCLGNRFPNNLGVSASATVAPLILSSSTPIKQALNF